jgi:predicted ribosome quality control (RQC) complex YloA/Tae2 family protein
MNNEKNQLIEKITFAVLPLLFTCVVYLMSALSKLSHEVTVLNSKISLVVTSDNKQATNTGAELAREKLRQDLEKEIQRNRDQIAENRQHIAILEEKATVLKKIGSAKVEDK